MCDLIISESIYLFHLIGLRKLEEVLWQKLIAQKSHIVLFLYFLLTPPPPFHFLLDNKNVNQHLSKTSHLKISTLVLLHGDQKMRLIKSQIKPS